ncbi:cytosolic acyl coenzyme A thioester hydrolase isoform X2 [Cololabis saira]|uniref:cytosolic acyl coenzyme A thioester hydrolase isoform X2 n=1 Tax=Cololabis saira TaxID=129043 RepID=UPI002AD2013F|nr:cytosolic acyl coenzyme A thioester hydrolase isoform X2 [Cololabis saira]
MRHCWNRLRGLCCPLQVKPAAPPPGHTVTSAGGVTFPSTSHRNLVASRELINTMSQTHDAPSSLQLCRIMRPDDANIMGNVHGGIILKMIEEAGNIVGSRHCNTQSGDNCVATLARVEKTEFLSPVFIGEVVHVSAEITYTSMHSLEVQVNVMAENIFTGAKKLANKAALWYVPCSLKNVDKIMEVPPIKYASAEQEEEGRKRYEAQKNERLETKARVEKVMPPLPNAEDAPKERYTVGFSQSSLIHLVSPSDCTLLDYVHGGVTMKLMDEVAGIVAARHCGTFIVTASVDAINFHRKIKKGCVVTVTGRLTFTSARSMEIEVMVDATSLVEEDNGKYRAVSAFFTFISLDKDNKPLPVPPLKVEGEEEQRLFEEGKARYLNNKAKRMKERQ